MRYPWPVAGPGRATRGRPTLQTSSNHHDLNRLTKTPVTNVVNPSPKTTIISEKALRLTTFVTTDQKSTQKTPWIDDVCNNTPPATLQRHSAAGVEGAGGTGGICRGAGGRRQDLAGLRPNAPSHTSVHQAPPVWRAPEGPEGTGGLRGAAPNEVRTPSLAGGRARRRPEHQRGHKHQHAARTARGRAAAHRHTQRPDPPAPGTPVGPQRNEAATGCPATASSRSRSAVHNSATSNQAVMST